MKVSPGIDVLLRRHRSLRGRRIGLVTNPTGVTADLRPTVDVLAALPAIELRALFGPEHGVRGDVQDGIVVPSSVDEATGLPVHSLYGPNRKPTPEMLAGLDLLIYDMQDVGCRYYTYPYTLSYVMEEAAEQDLEVMVLDRPNPLTGRMVEGPILDPGLSSFVGRYPIPVRYALTIGEWARYINEEYAIHCRLKVMPMMGWRRRQWFDQMGLPWVPPSPNIPALDTAIVYPGMCLVEGANVSEGRGTPRPFEMIGAPWINGRELAAEMNRRALPGVRFRPLSFTPTFSKHAGVPCQGVQVHVTARDDYRSFETGLHLVDALIKLDPDEFAFLPTSWEGRPPHFDLLSGLPTLRDALRARTPIRELVQSWQRDLRIYLRRRKAYLLYD